ncbi:MAG TPA: hypothetical protein VLT86_18575 [Vicinamibacterales bacterium]|nr:hypothetical protein [Vicinamibacterales bacterium]
MKSRFAVVAMCAIAMALAASAVSSQSSAASQTPKPTTRPAPPQAPKVGPVAPPTTDAEKIKSAMSAAPMAVAKDAAIMDMPSMRVLRPGTNGWTCIPDSPSPGVDPMCVDKNGMEWAEAWMNHKDPPKDKMALGYMLMGGSDASNTDPFATEPQAGAKWVDTGPHLMVFNVGDRFAGYPTTAANTKVPYVMWAGTPYAHLMIPVR